MKRKTFLLPVTLFAALLSLTLSACNSGNQGNKPGEESGQPTESAKDEKIVITAAGDKTKLMYGESVQLTASVAGVTWESAKPEVATVDANGLVTSVSKGSAAIKAKKDGYKDGSINISVDYPNITVSAAGNKTSLLIGETVNLTASEQGVTWSSTNPEVATVNNGVVTAVALGEATIKASKDHFNDGAINISVTRPEASILFDLTTDADHYAADGWWELPSAGGMSFAMQTINGWNPIAQAASWGQEVENPELFIGGFGAGDKETVKFNASKAGKAEVVLNIGNSDEAALATYMDIKLNGTAINLADVVLPAHAGDWGNSLAFEELSLGELDIVSGENTIVFEFKEANNLFLNELAIYGEMTATLVQPAAKEQIAVKEAKLEVIEEQTVAIESDVTGLSYVSVDETVATVDTNGVVTGVKMGKTNITVMKEGMYSVRVEITVNPKPVAGQIIIEAEDGEEVVDGYGQEAYMKQSDNSQWGGGGVHSGGAYVSFFSMGGGEVDLALTIKFQATEAKTMVLSVVGSAPINYMGDSSAYVFADSAELKVNDVAVTFTDQSFPAPQGYTADMVEIVIGDVAVVAGENTLVFHTTGSAPSLDCFKLSVKA